MAGDFDIKINIKTVLDGAGGLDEIVAKLKELQEAAAQVQAEGAEGGIVSPEAVARMNAALAGLTSGLGSGAAEAAAAAGEAGEAAAEAIAEASAEAGEAAGEAAEEAAETTADAAGEAAEAASDAAEESAEAAEEAAEQSSEAYIAGLEGLDEKLKEVAEDGGIDVLNLSGAFDSLKGAISGALGALTAYASYSGLKGLTESIISTGADFEATMLQVKAVTGATEEQYERMGEAANRLGAETEFSGKQAAQALNFLTSAGLDVDQALSALAGTLDLASAGALDLGTAADIATSILSGMGLEVERLGRVNDVLVKTVNTSNTSLTELGEAFKVVGPTANSLGYDIETISALLGQLANAGIRGSTAGTSLNAALLATQKAFDHYGVSAKNADGTTKDFVDALDLLREKGAGATVVSDIFGQAALKSVLSLQQSVEKDADSVREAIRSVRDESDGAALAAAETMRQGFKVVMDELGGALEGIGSASFERFLDPLKEAIRGVTEAVDHASPQFQKFTDGLMKAAVTGFKALAWLVEAGEWFQKSAVTTGLMTSAIVLLGTKITVVLVKAVSGFIVSLGRALVASASVTAQIKAGTVTAEQAAAMQKVLDGAYSAGMIPKGAYTSMTRQLTAVQNREALGTRALSVALREEAAAATAAATAGGAVAASSGAVAAASGAAAAALASETAAAGAASAALAAEGVAETGNVAATARETVASGAAATALRAEAGAAGTAAAALTGEASAAATAAAANAAVATTSRAAAGGLAAEGVAAGGAAAGLTAAGTAAGAAAGRMGLLRGAMMMLGGPVGLALIGIASLAGVLSYLKDSAQNAKQAIIDQNAAFIDAAKSVADYHGELVKLHEEQRKGVDISERLAQAAKAYAESKGASPELVALGVTATPEDTEKEQLRALYKARDSIRESMRAELQRDFDDGARWTPIGADTLKGLDDFVAKLRKKVDEARAEQAKFLAGESFDTAQVLKLPQLEKDLAEADERLNKRKETIRAAQVAELNTYTDLLMQMVQNKALSAEYAEKLFQDALTDMKDQISTEGLDFDELFGEIKFRGVADRLEALENKARELAESSVASAEQIAAALKFELDPALEKVMALASEFKGQKFFDAAALIQEAQAAGTELATQVEGWKSALAPRIKELNELLSEVNAPRLDPAAKAQFESELKSLNDKIKDMEDDLQHARVRLAADAAGKIEQIRAEELKGTQLTEKEKEAAYKKGAEAGIEAARICEKAAIESSIAAKQKVIEEMDAIIGKFRQVAAEGSRAAQVILFVAQVRKSLAEGQEGNLKDQLDEINARYDQYLKDLANLGSGGGGGGRGGGGGGGGGKSKEKEEDPSELAAAQAESARLRVEMAVEDMKDAVKKGSTEISGFVEDMLGSALAANEAEVQAALASAQKMSSGTAAEREKAQAAMEKATRDGAKATEKAYEETFTAIEEAYSDLINRINSKAEIISVKVEMGMMSEAQGRRELRKLLEENKPSLDALVEGMRQLGLEAEAAGLKMDFADRLEAAQIEALKLKSPLMEIANSINGVIRSSITGMLEDIAAGSVTLGEALRQFLYNIAQGLAQIAAQQIASGLMSMFGGAGGGIGGFLAGLIGAAEGGMVRGPGTATSDSVLARLSNGEYVISAKAVRYWGADFLDRINRLRLMDARALMPGYAAGGPVGDPGALRTSIIDNSTALARYVESPREEVKVDIGVKAEVDKERLVKIVLDHPDFSRKVQKSNVREKRNLLTMIGN